MGEGEGDARQQDGESATTENLRVVLVDSPLGVTDRGDILNHNDVIRVLAFSCFALGTGNKGSVERVARASVNHVVNDASLANYLALELGLYAQVVAIVATKVGCRTQ